MSISVASGFPVSSPSSTATVTTVHVGDLIVVMAAMGSSGGMTSITDSNSRVSWNSTVTVSYVDNANSLEADIWYGVVTSTGTTVVQPVWGGTQMGPEVNVYEYTDSSSVTWSVVGSNYRSTPGTTISWPSLTSGGVADQLYVGVAACFGMPSPGSTPGFTYTTTANTNMIVSDVTLANSTVYAPTAGSSSANTDTAGVIFAANPVGNNVTISFLV